MFKFVIILDEVELLMPANEENSVIGSRHQILSSLASGLTDRRISEIIKSLRNFARIQEAEVKSIILNLSKVH